MEKLLTVICILTFSGCSLNQTATDKALTDSNNELSFSAQPLFIDTIEGFKDIKMSFTESVTSDTSIIYKVNATYENKNLGFEISAPTKGSGRLILKNSGLNSDNFIRLLQIIYQQKVDSTAKFVGQIRADCISMGEYVDSLDKKNSGNYTTTAENKLFFQGTNEDDYAELYLNVNNSGHWIELKEKDLEYRPVLLKLLTRH